jgi:hypothetical protein
MLRTQDKLLNVGRNHVESGKIISELNDAEIGW